MPLEKASKLPLVRIWALYARVAISRASVEMVRIVLWFIFMACVFAALVVKGLGFMAALRVSAAVSKKGIGVLEGVAKLRVARDEASLAARVGAPPERRHQE